MRFRTKTIIGSVGGALAGLLFAGSEALSQVQTPTYDFFQPVPVYSLKRTFTPVIAPANPGLTKRWDSEVSRKWCKDQAELLPPGTVSELCNDYDVATSVHNGSMGDLPSQYLMPRQMDFASWFYWPWCQIRVAMGTGATASKVVEAGWDLTQDGMGFTYTGCYGLYEPVALPIVKPSAAKAQVLLGNSGSDERDDGADNVLPYLPGYLDPVNMAFNVDLLETEQFPISLVTGNFFNEDYQLQDKFLGGIFAQIFAFGDLFGRTISMLKPKFADLLGTSDVAILMRKNEGGKTIGLVSFLENRGLMKSTECITSSFATCGGCADPIHNWSASCQDCMTNAANPAFEAVKNGMNGCQRTISYEQSDMTESFALEGTHDPVFIGKYPVLSTRGSATAAGGKATTTGFKGYGPNWLLVVVNRGPVDCFPTDGSIRYRNPVVKADGTYDNKPAGDPDPAVIDIHDTEGIKYYADAGSVTVFESDPAADRCGYLTFYGLLRDAGTKKITVSPIKIGGNVLKIPAGYNPASFDFADINGDGMQDLVVANTGSQSEKIAGSVSVIHCYPDEEPASDSQPSVLDCLYGMVEKDFPMGDPALVGSLKSRHPWWVIAKAFKAHIVDANNNGTADNGEYFIQYGDSDPKLTVLPNDVAVTFIDSHETAKGDFLVMINGVDGLAATPGYRFWNNVKLTGTPISTNPLHDGILKRLASQWSLYPLGITAAPFNIMYDRKALGFDVLMLNFMSEVFQGFSVEPSDGLKSACQDIVVGLNNSHRAATYRNGMGAKVALKLKGVDENGAPKEETVSAYPCTASFVTAGSPAQRGEYLHDTTTPIYNAGSKVGDGNWGPVNLDVSWVNAGTERHGLNGEPTYLYNLNYADPTKDPAMGLDVQIDSSFDLGAVNAAVMKLGEWKVETASATPDNDAYKVPNDDCPLDEFEITTAVHVTKGFGGACDDGKKFCIDAGTSGPIPHRCAQRHGTLNPSSDEVGSKYLRGLKAEACCLILEEPTVASYVNTPVPSCPEDPMRCCVMQMPKTVSISSHYTPNPVVTGATYSAGAEKCQCLDEQSVLDAAIEAGNWSDVNKAAHDLLCCQDDSDPECNPPPPDKCMGLSGDVYKCCMDHGGVLDDAAIASCFPHELGKCTGLSGDILKCCLDHGGTLDDAAVASCFPPPPGKKPSCDDPSWGSYKHCCVDHDADHNGDIEWGTESAAVFDDPTCVPPNDPSDPGDDGDNNEGCTNVINIIAEPGSTVNLSGFNQCCQVVSIEGSSINDTIMQTCTTGDSQPTCDTIEKLHGDVPSWCNPACGPDSTMPGCEKPKGQEGLAPASCECAPADPKDVVEGETFSMTAAGKPTKFICKYTAPSTEGPLAMSAATQLIVETDDPFTAVDPSTVAEGGNAKLASLPTTSDTFSAWTPLITSWTDNPDYNAKVHAKLVAFDGTVTSSATCEAKARLGIGGGGDATSSCGCRFTAEGGGEDSLPQAVAAAMVLAALGLVRRRVAAKRVKK